MRRGLIYLIIFVVLLVAPTAVRTLQYYRLGGADRAEVPTYDPVEQINSVPTPSAFEFVDEPDVGQGFVLLDQAHENAFELEDLSFLDSRLAARGVELIPYEGGDLATALRSVNAFVVVAPLRDFSLNQIQAVADFVERGGHLFMVGDPTRFNVVIEEDLTTFNVIIETDKIPLNSLANEFDIIFNGDYLYNTIENEGNFRNIILHQAGFAEDALTADLEQLAFYGSHSLQIGSDAETLLAGDNNTWSSATDRPGGLSLAATGRDGRVLAVGDVDFLSEPYYTVYDNGRFIAQIADFLANASPRDYIVADFPYFFQNEIDLVYTGAPDLGPGAFDEIITLQDAFRRIDKSISLSAAPQAGADTLYVGLYNQTEEVAELLASADISLTINPPVLTAEEMEAAEEEAEEADDEEPAAEEEEAETDADSDEEDAADEDTDENGEEMIRLIQSDLGNVQMSGTALILLDEQDGQRQLVVLAASQEGLENTISRLLDLIPRDADYALADCLLQDNLALCPTDVADEEVEAELLTGGEPEEPDEEEDAEDEDEEEGDEEEPAPEIDAIDQGSIGLGETVEGELGEDERFAWTFSEGPAVIDITVESGESLDAVLELYDPDNNLLETADSGFTGEGESIIGAEIEDDGSYTILVRDFFDDGGSFTLTVTESEVAPDDEDEDEDGEGIDVFLFVDDDGEPIGDGFTSADRITELLGDAYGITTWISTEDGPLTEDELEGIELVIWDSGDYRNEDGFFDEDTAVIITYLDEGGSIFVTGSSPTLFGDIELAPVSDLEVAGDDPVLLEGLESGDIIELDQVYDVAFSDVLGEDTEEGSVAFLLRGPASDSPGNVIALASIDELNNDQQTVIMLLPFVALPEAFQETLFENMINWFELEEN